MKFTVNCDTFVVAFFFSIWEKLIKNQEENIILILTIIKIK